MKRIFLFAAAAAMILSSCSENDVTEVYSENDNVENIGFQMASFVSKTPVTTTTTINSKNNIVNISSNDAGFGTIEFKNTADGLSAWEQQTAGTTKKWNAVTTWPLKLYSANTGENTNGDVAVDGTTGKFDWTVEDAVADQKDLVFCGHELERKPSSGVIDATFSHALSNIFVTADVLDGTDQNVNAYIASVKLVNVCKKAKGTITPGAGKAVGSIAWDFTTTERASYTYLPTVAAPSAITTTDALAANNMYLLPQVLTGAAYDPANNAAGEDMDDIVTPVSSDESYVEVIYRWDSNTTPAVQLVGAANEAALERLSLSVVPVTTPLYVKVAFPLNYTFSPNKKYNIILPMDGKGNGGYLLDLDYVNADGSTTNVAFDPTGYVELGDAVLTDRPIGLNVVEVVEYVTPDEVIDENITAEGTVLD